MSLIAPIPLHEHSLPPTPFVLRDLEHELRFPRYPIRLRPAAGQYVGHLRQARCTAGKDTDSLARRPDDWPAHPANHRCDERPHVELARPPAAIFHRRRIALERGVVFYAGR